MGVSLMKSQPRISSVRFSAPWVRAGVALDIAAMSTVTLVVLRFLVRRVVFIIEEMVLPPSLSIFNIPLLCDNIREGI